MTEQAPYAELVSALESEHEFASRRRPFRRPPPRWPSKPALKQPPRYSPALIRWVQTALNQVVGSSLTINGLLDLPTRKALRAFQRRVRLWPNGLPTAQTVAALRKAVQAGSVRTAPKSRCLVLGEFDFDRAELKSHHHQQIATLARQIVAAGITQVRITGHTDPAGTDAYNLALGERRARSVATALQQAIERIRPGYSRTMRLTVESRGEREPIPGPAARQRRVAVCLCGSPACGTAPATTALRQAMAAIARQEWERWGRGTRKEHEPAMRDVLANYWRQGVGYLPKQANWWSTVPWSAAFISWVVRRAGGGDRFRYAAGHSYYIVAAKQNRQQQNNNPFKAYRINEVKPRIGDIVCKDRGSGATYDTIREGMATHCDIVVGVQPGRLMTIGGNLSNSVGISTVKTDADGYINQPGYFAVIRVGD